MDSCPACGLEVAEGELHRHPSTGNDRHEARMLVRALDRLPHCSGCGLPVSHPVYRDGKPCHPVCIAWA